MRTIRVTSLAMAFMVLVSGPAAAQQAQPEMAPTEDVVLTATIESVSM